MSNTMSALLLAHFITLTISKRDIDEFDALKSHRKYHSKVLNIEIDSLRFKIAFTSVITTKIKRQKILSNINSSIKIWTTRRQYLGR